MVRLPRYPDSDELYATLVLFANHITRLILSLDSPSLVNMKADGDEPYATLVPFANRFILSLGSPTSVRIKAHVPEMASMDQAEPGPWSTRTGADTRTKRVKMKAHLPEMAAMLEPALDQAERPAAGMGTG